MKGRLPEDLREELRAEPALQEVAGQLEALQGFALALAGGNLEPELRVKGRVAGALKTLQANLRHLTWQAQSIAAGDLSQQVHFMGEFASAFNQMVENLRQSHGSLEARAHELAEGRRAAINLMLDAQAARQEAEAANARLQVQMGEVQALQELLREQAIRDPLTGLFNRRYLEETLEREFSRALREGYPVSLVMIDLDHFKCLNDACGHAAGDRVLQALAGLLAVDTRAGDIACRYGGEEFLMVLPNMPPEVAMTRAEGWRVAFQKVRIASPAGEVQATLSAGVAAFPLHAGTIDAALQAADAAMYAAKQSGRNRVARAV